MNGSLRSVESAFVLTICHRICHECTICLSSVEYKMIKDDQVDTLILCEIVKAKAVFSLLLMLLLSSYAKWFLYHQNWPYIFSCNRKDKLASNLPTTLPNAQLNDNNVLTLVHKRDELRSGPHFNRYIIQRKHKVNAEKLSIFLTIKIMRISFVSNKRAERTTRFVCIYGTKIRNCVYFSMGKMCVCVSARLKAVIAA